MRLGFLGSPPFATPVLAKLLASRHAVLGVVTPPDRRAGRGRVVRPSPLVEAARSAGLEVIQPETTKDPALVDRLRQQEPDVLLVASYGEILRRDLLDLAPQGALNVHASLLPRHRGASPIQAAILAADAETGVSIQRMVLALDEGDVLHEVRTPIGPRETSGELLDRLSVLGGEAAVHALDLVESGKALYRSQNPEEATYARRIAKAAGQIDWSKSAVEVDRHVRAMSPWPGARTKAPNGREIVILALADPQTTPQESGAAPGTILQAGPQLLVATGRGVVEILELTPSGSVRMDASAWLRGARLTAGETFTL
jgi:methionyl-tRNA formyltransferase